MIYDKVVTQGKHSTTPFNGDERGHPFSKKLEQSKNNIYIWHLII
jgi:hypothetical protein